jgi:small subunit ribosomal protein S4e
MAKLKRLVAPKFWKIPKKVKTWVVSPSPGPHGKFDSIPLLIIVRDILGLTETAKEARSVVKKGEILVDGKPRKDIGYPAGLMDAVSIPKLSKFYRIVPSSKGLKLIEIPEKESMLKILNIKNKTLLNKGKVQLNFHDGKNLTVDKDVYKTGDSLLVELPSFKILEHIKLEKGSVGIILKGANAGKLAEVKDILVSRTSEPNKVVCEHEKEKLKIVFDYFLVVGKKSPLITVSE